MHSILELICYFSISIGDTQIVTLHKFQYKESFHLFSLEKKSKKEGGDFQQICKEPKKTFVKLLKTSMQINVIYLFTKHLQK